MFKIYFAQAFSAFVCISSLFCFSSLEKGITLVLFFSFPSSSSSSKNILHIPQRLAKHSPTPQSTISMIPISKTKQVTKSVIIIVDITCASKVPSESDINVKPDNKVNVIVKEVIKEAQSSLSDSYGASFKTTNIYITH